MKVKKPTTLLYMTLCSFKIMGMELDNKNIFSLLET